MQMAYLRASKRHSIARQKAVLAKAGFTDWADDGPSYIDEKPKRGDAAWEWRDRVIQACRPGARDEVWVAMATVWGSSVQDALGALQQLAERGGVLVIAETEERYYWHPDAALALSLAQRIARENARLNTDAAREKRRENTRNSKRRDVEKRRAAKAAWLDPTLTSEDVVKQTGYSRAMLNRMFGARGTKRFVGGKVTP